MRYLLLKQDQTLLGVTKQHPNEQGNDMTEEELLNELRALTAPAGRNRPTRRDQTSKDPISERLQARGRLKRDGLTAALENLRYKHGSVFDFQPVRVGDDEKFREANPDHPMAKPQRFIRQEAADFINDVAAAKPTLIDHTILPQLHQAVFDRDPAVRLVIAEALGKLRRPESVGTLERLLAIEEESGWVRNAAEKSLRTCQGR